MEKRFLPDLTIHQWNSYFPNWRRGSNWASWMATSENIDPHLGRNSVANRMFFSILDIVLKCASAIVRRLGLFKADKDKDLSLGGSPRVQNRRCFQHASIEILNKRSQFFSKFSEFQATCSSPPSLGPPAASFWRPSRGETSVTWSSKGGRSTRSSWKWMKKNYGKNMFINIYIYNIYLCVCVCVSISIYIDLYLFISICLSLSIYYVHLSISIYIDLYHIYHFSISVYIHIYMYIYVYICVYIYVYIYISLSIYILLYFLQNVDRIEFSGWSRMAKLMHCHIWRKPCKFLRKVILQASSKPMMSFWSFGNNKGPVWMVWRTMCETWNKPLFVHQIINTPLSAKADQNTPRKRKSIRLCPIISPYIPMVSCGHEKKWHLVPAPHVASGPSHALTQPGLARCVANPKP